MKKLNETHARSECNAALLARGLSIDPPKTLSMLSRSMDARARLRQKAYLLRERHLARGLEPDATFGERLRSWRLRAGLTQWDLSRRIGVSQGHISNVELARTRMAPAHLVVAARHLDTTVDDLLYGPESNDEQRDGVAA